MKVNELITQLQKHDGNDEVLALVFYAEEFLLNKDGKVWVDAIADAEANIDEPESDIIDIINSTIDEIRGQANG
jgi:hypothetical protein